jgi:hypothetical protein
METVGFGEWNIDIVKSADPVSDVADRLDHLDELESIKSAAAGRWASLKNTQDTALREFARAVCRHSQGSCVASPQADSAHH